MELDYARSFSSPDEPGARQLESQLSVVDEQLRDLEGAPEGAPVASGAAPGPEDAETGMFPAAHVGPRASRGVREALPGPEGRRGDPGLRAGPAGGGRATEARDVSTFQVLDPPTLATKASWPDRPRSMIAAAILGLAAGIAWQWWLSRRRNT